MSTPAPDPDPATVFDHLRAEDREHVGYIELTADGEFVPYDLLRQRRGAPMDLDEAEAVLDGIGLRLLAEDWLLAEGGTDPDVSGPANGSADEPGDATWTKVRIREVTRDRVVVGRTLGDLSGTTAKTIDLVGGIELALPTDRLRPDPGPASA